MASASGLPRGPLLATATCMTSAGLALNAIPSPMASKIGNPNDQNNASGSRVYSLKRTVMSCQSELSLMSQLPPRQRHEDVLERRRMCRQVRQFGVALREQRQQGGNGSVKRA